MNCGLYLITDHPMHHSILIRFPINGVEPVGWCEDCKDNIEVRFLNVDWLDVITELNIDLEKIEEYDQRTRAYAKGVINNLEQSISNFDKSVQMKIHQKRRKEYYRRRSLVLDLIRENSGSSTKALYDLYCWDVQNKGERPRTYRRFSQIVSELEEGGFVHTEKENRGRYGIRNLVFYGTNNR